MKKIGLKVASLLTVVSLFGGVMMAPGVSATVTCPDGSLQTTAPTLAGCNVSGGNTLMSSLQVIINVVIGVLGFVSVAMIVLGGVQYVTSAGDSSKTKKAKDTIMYAVIGLVVAILAFAIVNFVLKNVFAPSTPSKGSESGTSSSAEASSSR